jgi:hypothetical protein
MNDLGFVKPVDGRGERVVVARADTSYLEVGADGLPGAVQYAAAETSSIAALELEKATKHGAERGVKIKKMFSLTNIYHGPAEKSRDRDQHGWQRDLAGQFVRGKALADHQIQGGLPVGLCQRLRGARFAGPIPRRLLLHPSAPLEPWRADAGRGLLCRDAINPDGGLTEAGTHLGNALELFK